MCFGTAKVHILEHWVNEEDACIEMAGEYCQGATWSFELSQGATWSRALTDERLVRVRLAVAI
jgi:hypothetical protein